LNDVGIHSDKYLRQAKMALLKPLRQEANNSVQQLEEPPEIACFLRRRRSATNRCQKSQTCCQDAVVKNGRWKRCCTHPGARPSGNPGILGARD